MASPLGESLLSLLICNKWIIVFFIPICSCSCLPWPDICLHVQCLLLSWPWLLVIWLITLVYIVFLLSMLLDMRNHSPVKLRLSEFNLRKPWCAAWKIQLVLLLAKMSELLPDSDFLLFFPSCIYIMLPLWFYEWNVMFRICIKVLSLGAPSVLETFMDINLGKKFFAIHDIFLPLYFSCPRFMWKDYT